MTSEPDSNASFEPGFYAPTQEEAAFLKTWTGINDDEELKQHVLAVQKEAWDVSANISRYHVFFLAFLQSQYLRLSPTLIKGFSLQFDAL